MAGKKVLGSRAVPPSLRGTGGTELILRIEGLAQPQQSIISDPQAATWRPGQRLQLQWPALFDVLQHRCLVLPDGLRAGNAFF